MGERKSVVSLGRPRHRPATRTSLRSALPLPLTDSFCLLRLDCLYPSLVQSLQSLASKQRTPETNQEHRQQSIMFGGQATSLANSSKRGNPFLAAEFSFLVQWWLPHTWITGHRNQAGTQKLHLYFCNTGKVYACYPRRKRITNLTLLWTWRTVTIIGLAWHVHTYNSGTNVMGVTFWLILRPAV